jgi:hypothetical protein
MVDSTKHGEVRTFQWRQPIGGVTPTPLSIAHAVRIPPRPNKNIWLTSIGSTTRAIVCSVHTNYRSQSVYLRPPELYSACAPAGDVVPARALARARDSGTRGVARVPAARLYSGVPRPRSARGTINAAAPSRRRVCRDFI